MSKSISRKQRRSKKEPGLSQYGPRARHSVKEPASLGIDWQAVINTGVGMVPRSSRTDSTIPPQAWEARECTFNVIEEVIRVIKKAIKETQKIATLPLAPLLVAESESRDVVVLALLQLAEISVEHYRAESINAKPDAVHAIHPSSRLVERMARDAEKFAHTLGVHIPAVPRLHADLGLYQQSHSRGRPSDERLLQIISGLFQLVKTQLPKQPFKKQPAWYSLLGSLLRCVWPPLPFKHTPGHIRARIHNYRTRCHRDGATDLAALKIQCGATRNKFIITGG